MRLDIQKVGILSSDVWLARDGQTFVQLSLSSLRERVTFDLDGRVYHVQKSDADGVLVLVDTSTNLPLAQRVKLSVFSPDCDVEAMMPDGAVHFIRLDRVSGMKRRVELRVGGVAVGEVAQEGLWKTRLWADVPEAWPMPVSVFVVWLALRIFLAEDASAAA